MWTPLYISLTYYILYIINLTSMMYYIYYILYIKKFEIGVSPVYIVVST